MWSTARHIARGEGVRALFWGLLPRAFRNCGAVIILNTTLTGVSVAQHAGRLTG
jgi:hypothetical protein